MDRILYESWFYQNLDTVLSTWHSEKRVEPPIDEEILKIRELLRGYDELLRERLGKGNEVVLDEYLKLLRRNYIEESKHVFVRGMQFSARFLVKTLFDEDNKPHFDNKGLHNSMKPEE